MTEALLCNLLPIKATRLTQYPCKITLNSQKLDGKERNTLKFGPTQITATSLWTKVVFFISNQIINLAFMMEE